MKYTLKQINKYINYMFDYILPPLKFNLDKKKRSKKRGKHRK